MTENDEEWFYESISRYKNLNMFELEHPVHHLELSDHRSICVSCSNKRRHQLLQLALPTKLVSQVFNSSEMVITNDTDLKIKCGTFTECRISCMKASHKGGLIIASHINKLGAVVYELPADESDQLKEKSAFDCKLEGPCLALNGDELVLSKDSVSPIFLMNVETGKPLGTVPNEDTLNCSESVTPEYINPSLIALCHHSSGRVQLYDKRDGKLSNCISCDKSNGFWTFSSQYECCRHDQTLQSSSLAILSSNGTLKIYDTRNMNIPCFNNNLGINKTSSISMQLKFKPSNEKWVSVSGFDGYVYVYKLTSEPELVFVHDGHRHVEGYSANTITTAHLWFPGLDNLLISSAENGTVQSWQFEDKRNICV